MSGAKGSTCTDVTPSARDVFTIPSGGLGTANLPYFIYQTFYTAQDYGRASAAGVVVVIGTIIIATAALRTAFSLFKEEAR